MATCELGKCMLLCILHSNAGCSGTWTCTETHTHIQIEIVCHFLNIFTLYLAALPDEKCIADCFFAFPALRNATNAPAVISGVMMLQQLLHATPRGIYWGFISARVIWMQRSKNWCCWGLRVDRLDEDFKTKATALRLPQQTAEDLALMRLACLSRVQAGKGSLGFTTESRHGGSG